MILDSTEMISTTKTAGGRVLYFIEFWCLMIVINEMLNFL